MAKRKKKQKKKNLEMAFAKRERERLWLRKRLGKPEVMKGRETTVAREMVVEMRALIRD